MEVARDLYVPVERDHVLSPQLCYGDPFDEDIWTAIYFITEDEQYGRITFEGLDSIKISRGEYFPYPYKKSEEVPYSWVKIVENSRWQKERFNYEKTHYGSSYEFGGDVNEMLYDYKHYVFSFHDEFIEAIAQGIWFETSSEKLLGKALLPGHPFLPLPESNTIKIEAYGLICQVRINSKDEEILKRDARLCSQTLMEFALELGERPSINHTLSLILRNNKYISVLRGYFGQAKVEFDKIPTLEEVKPYIESYMKEVAERRRGMQR